ncbi:polysaccharide pyruvyl transferase family protein [Microbacterium esteraromaticum]|uniref:polysaccharide pyruvyl transferase family protein n=1 Tax=Microbacterium esteraromaticum TaxID=57043 RepID=UPI001C94E9A2|nr:polysaccharide pyruvyl transferase family protein [Microbacterium esteraromaticum]MBY6060273.1 polysaccharide pyruvyl transferase family protein [Microbacterium esteraromaticum]
MLVIESGPTGNDARQIGLVRERLLAELRGALRGRTEAILLDVAAHGNAGDLLIVRGALEMLSDLGVRVRMIQVRRLTSWHHLQRLPSHVAVLMTGGGNMGGLYPAHDEHRARVLRSVSAERVIILPQSVNISSEADAQVLRAAYGDHPGAVYMIRDRVSAARLADAVPSIAGSIRHTPDLAFGTTLARPEPPTCDVRVLKRGDGESRMTSLLESAQGAVVHESDWPSLRGGTAHVQAIADHMRRCHFVHRNARRVLPGRKTRDLADAALERLWEPGQQRLLRAHIDQSVESLARTLSEGRVVVTDRLHAHLGAMLLGIPNVVLPSIDGKAHALIDDWSRQLSTTHIADDRAEASALTARLLI